MSRDAFAGIALAVFLSGCGSGSKPAAPPVTLAPVGGTVKMGGKPASRVAISVVPTGTTKGQGGWAVTDEAGQFKVIHSSQQEGIEPGEYRAVFSLYVKPNGEPIPPNTSPTDSMAVQGVPVPWSDPGSTAPAQTISVSPAGKMDLAFDLPAPKVPRR